MNRAAWAFAGVLLAGALSAESPARRVGQPPGANACLDCHLALDDSRLTPPAKAFSGGDDVHSRAGFTCVFCHGGDPTKEDMDEAHDRKKGWIGKPAPRDIPLVCGKCHGDAALIKQFNPSLRVDQLAEYLTSGHGKKLAQGDPRVAQCASCHGAHGILHVKDTRSPVSTTQVAKTCNGCHGDAELMSAHKLPSDAYAKYTRSVHYAARTKGDLSAPTCNSCHGNHGAAPPQVASVVNVCGTCHVVFAEQFKASPHWEAFSELGLPGCVTCHENHEIVKPTEAFLADGPQSRCASCHEPDSPAGKAIVAIRTDLLQLDRETKRARDVLRQAAEAGMEVSRQQFDLVKADNALTKARADVHMFQASAVHRTVSEGLAVARAARVAGLRSLKERDFRRKGLFVALGLILIAIGAVVIKIRQIDSDRSSRPAP
jgi:hypothetical protein